MDSNSDINLSSISWYGIHNWSIFIGVTMKPHEPRDYEEEILHLRQEIEYLNAVISMQSATIVIAEVVVKVMQKTIEEMGKKN